jgi:hypothetical protein
VIHLAGFFKLLQNSCGAASNSGRHAPFLASP